MSGAVNGMPVLPRGVRNNNPGNIRRGDIWQGLSKVQTDKSFCQFDTAELGIRALGIVLLNYRNKYGLNTIRKIITRWAPPVENNTDAYVNAVAKACGVKPDDAVDVQAYLIPMAKAIISHENGQQPYSDTRIKAGLTMSIKAAGIAKLDEIEERR